MRYLHRDFEEVQRILSPGLPLTRLSADGSAEPVDVSIKDVASYYEETQSLFGEHPAHFIVVGNVAGKQPRGSLRDLLRVAEQPGTTAPVLLVGYQDGGLISVSSSPLPSQGGAQEVSEWYRPEELGWSDYPSGSTVRILNGGPTRPSILKAKVGTMDELVLRYERDDEPNFCGPLTVTVEANGFRGHCDWAYVTEAWLVELAEMLRRFPLPEEGIANDLMMDSALGFTIHAIPDGSLGRIILRVKVTEIVRGNLDHSVEVALVTDYAALDRFSRALVAAARSGCGEARIGE